MQFFTLEQVITCWLTCSLSRFAWKLISKDYLVGCYGLEKINC